MTGKKNWDDRFDEIKTWSNVACVHRGDEWAEVLKKFIVQV